MQSPSTLPSLVSWERAGLVRTVYLLGLLQLHLQPLGAHLKPIHSLDGALCRHCIVEGHESKTLAEVGGFVDEDLSTDDGSERCEHLHKVRVCHVIGKVVDEEVAPVRT